MPLSLRTFSGIEMDLLDVRPEHIKIEDIAHALSYQCRFVGHIKNFYSVAEHSLNLSLMIQPLYRIYVMLHDAHEAYFGDISKPLKNIIVENWPGYNDLITRCDKAIIKALGLDYPMFLSVKKWIEPAEAELFKMEVDVLHARRSLQLQSDHPLYGAEWGMIPPEAEKTFLSIYQLLSE